MPSRGKLNHVFSLLRQCLKATSGHAGPVRPPALDTEASQPDASAAPAAPSTGRIGRVLLAEDTTTVATITQKLLENAGYQCTVVKDGEEALAQLVRRDFDAALLDMNMPAMNGIEVVKAYHFMEPADMRMPVILFSADGSAATREASLAAGAAAFLPKPLSRDTLQPLLERLVKNSGDTRFSGPLRWTAWSPPVPAQLATTEAIINYSTLAELDGIGPDSEFVNTLLLGFIKDNRARVARLDDLLHDMRYEEFREHVHALKGAAMSIGATSLKHICQQVEKLPTAELGQDSENVMAAVRGAFDQLCDVLDRYLERRGRPASNDY